MILSYPKVKSDGELTGGEISFRFKDLVAVEQLHHYRFRPDDREETEVVVPGCCTVVIGRNDFNIKAEYAEIVVLFKQLNEMYE